MKSLIFQQLRCSAFKSVVVLTTVVLFSTPLLAQQPVTSLSELSNVKAGDHIEVTVSDGRVVKGKYESVTESALRMRFQGRSQEISGPTITAIKKRRPDSNLNGIVLGLVGGLVGGAVATGVTCQNDRECEANAGAVFMPVFMGGGAAVGALLDELTHSYDSVYVSKSASGTRLRLSPMVSRDTKGVRLTMKF